MADVPWMVGPTHHESEGKTWVFFSHQTHVVAADGLTDIAIVDCGDDEGDENTHLIAAAPDLLAACEALVERVRILAAPEVKATLAAWPKSGVEYVGVDPADYPEVKAGLAALNKAKRRS